MNAESIELLDRVAVPVFVLEPDAQGRPVYVAFNRTAREVAGWRNEDIVGRTAVELYAGRYGEDAFAHHARALASATASTYELSLPLNGSRRRILTNLQPVLADDGRVERLIGTCEDITALETARQAQDNSAAQVTDIEEFVSLAAHDLRSPIRQVNKLSEMICKDFQDLGDGKLRLLQMLEGVAGKTMKVIGEMLDHVQTVGSVGGAEQFELQQLCQEMTALIDPAGTHTVSVRACQIDGDRIAAQAVLRNLIDNALKHNANKPVALTIRAESFDDDHYQVTVADDGSGFTNPAMAFLDGQRSRIAGGFGLITVRRLIHARGGTISARNDPTTGGAVVRFTLPGHCAQAIA